MIPEFWVGSSSSIIECSADFLALMHVSSGRHGQSGGGCRCGLRHVTVIYRDFPEKQSEK